MTAILHTSTSAKHTCDKVCITLCTFPPLQHIVLTQNNSMPIRLGYSAAGEAGSCSKPTLPTTPPLPLLVLLLLLSSLKAAGSSCRIATSQANH
jgi:hypothetical protein